MAHGVPAMFDAEMSFRNMPNQLASGDREAHGPAVDSRLCRSVHDPLLDEVCSTGGGAADAGEAQLMSGDHKVHEGPRPPAEPRLQCHADQAQGSACTGEAQLVLADHDVHKHLLL